MEPTPPESHYIHGADPEEQQRLSLLNRMVNERSLAEMSLRGGERILDLGSGLGQMTRAMGRAAGAAGKVIGIERDRDQIAEARRQAMADGEEDLVEIREGDVLDLPLREEEWGSFDVVHARWLLQHVPRPESVVASMVRAARPGGRIILMDDDHGRIRTWPEPPGLGRLWEAYERSFMVLGNDPHLGRRLAALLHAAGAAPSRAALIPYAGCAGSEEFSHIVKNMIRIIEEARVVILERGLLDEGSFNMALGAFRAWGERPDAALWYSFCWAEGRRGARASDRRVRPAGSEVLDSSRGGSPAPLPGMTPRC